MGWGYVYEYGLIDILEIYTQFSDYRELLDLYSHTCFQSVPPNSWLLADDMSFIYMNPDLYQWQMGEYYSYVFNLRPNICKSWYLGSHAIPNTSENTSKTD